MSFFDYFSPSNWAFRPWRPGGQTDGPAPSEPVRPRPNSHRREVGDTAGGRRMAGRVSVDRQEDLFGAGLAGMAQFSPSPDVRDYNIDPKALRRMTPSKLMELMVDVSPDVSRALHDFLTFFGLPSLIKLRFSVHLAKYPPPSPKAMPLP